MNNKWRCLYDRYAFVKSRDELYPTATTDNLICFAVGPNNSPCWYDKRHFEEIVELQYTQSQEGDLDDDI